MAYSWAAGDGGIDLRIEVKSQKRWMKAELHCHCSIDPVDYRICTYTPEELIYQAARLEYEILAITCHDKDIWTEALSEYARNLGITLIPGMEVTTEGIRHALVYNFRTGPESLNTLKKIRAHSREDTMVIVPHAFFPGRTCLRDLIERNLDLFDAIEYSGFHVRGVNFNKRGIELATRACKPLVGSGDIHQLWQLGRTYTWIYAVPDTLSIVHAVKQGFVRLETTPISWAEAAGYWATALWRGMFSVNPPPSAKLILEPSGSEDLLDQVEDGRCLGTAQQGVEP
jgi:predicted metal-dependent phosphoesterase TrpH